MSRRYEEPTVTKTGNDETKETHPAYAQIQASRVHGGHIALYGSDFCHNNHVAIRIYDSTLRRNLSNDWHYAGKEYLEVALSEAQWATFVSSLNIGMGVPCTLRYKDGHDVPDIPEPPRRRDQFKTEVKETMADALRALQELKAKIADAKLTNKGKDDLSASVAKAIQEITANVPYVEGQFEEHVEKTLEAAKVEVAAYTHAVLLRAGLKAVADGILLELPSGPARSLTSASAPDPLA